MPFRHIPFPTTMVNRIMRVLVMFDLPVTTEKDRKEYTRFRKHLISDGFSMLQFSIYCRITRNHDDAKKHIQRLKFNLPPEGSVRVMSITEKQYSSMQILVGEKTAGEILLTTAELIEL